MDHDPYFRYPVHVNAKLFSTELRAPIDCVIRNLSEEGAQLALREPANSIQPQQQPGSATRIRGICADTRRLRNRPSVLKVGTAS